MTSTGGHGSRGLVGGSLTGIAFGLVFVVANSGRLADGWALGVRVAGVLAAAALVVAVLVAARTGPTAGGERSDRSTLRGYLLVVGAEVVALFAGLVVLNRMLGLPELNIVWIALVVGAHFFGLGRVWRLALFHVFGAVLVTLAVVGAVMYAYGAPVVGIDLVAGVGSGVTLFAMVIFSLLAHARQGDDLVERA